MKLDDVDVSSLLDEMAAQSMARAVADLASVSDQYSSETVPTRWTNAEDWFRDSIIRTAPFLLAEHISWQLKSSKHHLPPLRELRDNADFVKAYYTKLLDQNFIRGTILKDIVNYDHHYSTFLLFSLAYFEAKPELKEIISGESIWTRQVGTVGAAWIVELIGVSKCEIGDVTHHISRGFSPLFAANESGRLDVCKHDERTRKLFVDNLHLTQILAQHHPQSKEIAAQIQSRLQTIQAGSLAQWSSIQDVLLTEWRSKMSVFDSAAQSCALQQRQHKPRSYGGSRIVTTWTGEKVAQLIDTGNAKYPKYFSKAAPKHSREDVESMPSFNCLAPGTIIHTETGSKAVQDLQDGEALLARGNFKEYKRAATYGKVSREDRRIPVEGAVLYGFNDEDAFFTSSHIFHTTTGLRALDPSLACRQNPTLAIGQLNIGHVLFRIDDELNYSYVVIRSISSREAPDLDCVYNLHLSEARSYHANGYLVSVSYPEITPKDVAESLQRLSPYDRLRLLQKFPEVQAILQQHDTETLRQALDIEIKQEAKRRTARFYQERAIPSERLQLSDITLAYVTETVRKPPSAGADDAPPKMILLQEGVVCIDDDKPLAQASIDSNARSLMWTRQLGPDKWEHGMLKLDQTGLSGHGAVFFTNEAEPDSSNAEEFRMNAIYFTVASQAPDMMAEKPAEKPEFSAMMVDENVSSRHAMVADTQLSVASTADSNTDLVYTLQFDGVAMAPTDTLSSSRPLQSATKFGNIIIHTDQIGGPTGMRIPIVKVPFLDRLCQAMNAAAPQLVSEAIAKLKTNGPTSEGDYQTAQDVKSLYSSSVIQNKDGNMVANVRMFDASALSEMADFSDVFEKTFQAVTNNSNASVPLIFQEMEVTISSDFTTAYGVVYEWNPDCKGMMGNRHYLHSTTLQDELDVKSTTREANATAAGGLVSNDPSVPMSTPQLPPSSAAGTVDPHMAAMDCGPLQNLDGYNEFSIHRTTQNMLQIVVRYHMADDDRANFLGTTKPTTLPKELADGLDPTLITWLSGTYCKAYISWIIAQGLDSGFSDDELDRLWYWWQGSSAGDGKRIPCLKKSPQYAELNQVVAAYATRQLYAKPLSPYIEAGGSIWAAKLAGVYTDRNAMNGLIHSLDAINGVNPVNKICNIMNALDPTGTQAKSFYTAFINYAVGVKAFSGPYIGDTDVLRTYLYDAMNELATMVLNDDQSLDADLKAGIRQDLAPILLEKQESVQTQVALLKDNLQYMSTLIVKQIGAVKKGINFRGVGSLMDSIAGTVHPDDPTNWPKTFKCLRGLAIAGLIGSLLTLSATTFLNWKQASAGQKWLAVSAILQTLSTTLSTLRYFKQNPIRAAQAINPGDNPGGGRRGGILLDNQRAQELRVQLGIQQPLNQVLEGPDRINLNDSASTAATLNEPPIGPLDPDVHNRPPFNVGMTLLKCLDIFAGIGFVVGMSLELRDNYKNMDTFQKTMTILQVVVQGLIVVCDVATLGLEIAVSFGYVMEAAATACMTLASIGAVLGVIAIVAMLALIIYDYFKPKPPTEAQKFVSNNKAFVDNLMPPPSVNLSYSISPDKVSLNSSTQIIVTMTNPKEKPVTLRQIDFQMSGGTTDTSLFQNKTLVAQTSAGAVSATATGPVSIYFTTALGSDKTMTLDPNPADSTFVYLTGNIASPHTADGQLGPDIVFGPGETCSLAIDGYVSDKSGKVAITITEEMYINNSRATDVGRKNLNVQKS
ncbi:hypothetical protein HJFPF1_07346 [Paramyrothecium foliicola]|nr:hypothetical protein HJFPF1_07346 [Paramyrothecium foliicola]